MSTSQTFQDRHVRSGGIAESNVVKLDVSRQWFAGYKTLVHWNGRSSGRIGIMMSWFLSTLLGSRPVNDVPQP